MSDTLLGVIIGGLLTSIPTFITFWIGKRSDERRHLREISFNAALDNWKHAIDVAGRRQVPVSIDPLDVYLIHMLKLSEVAARRGLTAKNVAERMREVQDIVRQASDEAKAHTNRRREEKKNAEQQCGQTNT